MGTLDPQEKFAGVRWRWVSWFSDGQLTRWVFPVSWPEDPGGERKRACFSKRWRQAANLVWRFKWDEPRDSESHESRRGDVELLLNTQLLTGFSAEGKARRCPVESLHSLVLLTYIQRCFFCVHTRTHTQLGNYIVQILSFTLFICRKTKTFYVFLWKKLLFCVQMFQSIFPVTITIVCLFFKLLF